jgi:hypothetical protein
VPLPLQASITSSNCDVPARSHLGFPPVDPLFFGFPCFLLIFLCICFCFLVFVLVFCCIAFLYVSMFFGFFAISVDLLCAGFVALRPLSGFFCAPTTANFHRALLCMGSAYTRSVSFPIFLFCLYSILLLLFSLYFRLLFDCNNALALMVRLDPF